jgi:F-type H+-transporting ATPase subunit gamma
MPSLIDIRRRIRAVKSTQQITKAMKMVAASKLRRSQERIMNARPYSRQMMKVLRNVAARVDSSVHPLLARPESCEGAKSLLIVITADKGMSGSFNANIIRAAGAFIVEHPHPVVLGLVGRKGRDFFARRSYPARFELVNFLSKLDYLHGQAIAKEAIAAFTAGEVCAVYVAFNEFKSVLQQRVVVEQLLPILPADLEEGEKAAAGVEYLYEPSAQAIFDELLPRYVEQEVFHALLESNAAQNAAQMVAMDNATKNSGEVIEALTLYMNKLRQAAITREIIEVVSGAQAL